MCDYADASIQCIMLFCTIVIEEIHHGVLKPPLLPNGEHMAHGFDIFNKILLSLKVRISPSLTIRCLWRCVYAWDDDDNNDDDVLFPLHIYKSLGLAWSVWLGLAHLVCIWFGFTITIFYQWHTVHTTFSVTMFS